MRRRDGACCVSLTTWPEHLAISTLQQRQQDADCAGGGRGFRTVAFPTAFPKGYGGMKKVRAWMEDFHRLPYEDCSGIYPESDLMERRVVGVLHEVPCAKAKGATVIAITSVEGNKLAKISDMNVHLPVERELCPFNLAPVTSTAIQMVFGDTVAVALMGARRLTKEQYAANHPAGKIGKRLIFKVKDVKKKDEELPICKETDLIMDQLVELTSKGCGCLLVVDDENYLIGTFTDGDLRRTLRSNGQGIFKLTVGDMCNRSPSTINPQAMAVEAMQKMESPPYPVQFLPVVDDRNIVVGIITLHDLVSAGL